LLRRKFVVLVLILILILFPFPFYLTPGPSPAILSVSEKTFLAGEGRRVKN
jgi:hypothetical protein